MANIFHLFVDGNDNKKLLEIVPEDLINEELLELKWECVAEERAGEKKTEGNEKAEPQEHSRPQSHHLPSSGKSLVEACADFIRFLKIFENLGPK